ncbi:MAG: hypothetical protein A2908_04030 [Candidatus Staskawiczbacteria bacterium RIFCSPLOWO2_01_FULL_38_12b]|uniref:Glycosyltransferase RgtA/B/C/D-like domain-containing protein n=1 Tax=Candidatus Staskawiczbacteria bacterium RIFCSPLOWO2_01_FULL_38_12b TaxID=1802214 RepID=A0A1G2ICS8_9BACT|nr:MAG: hypothetical protein A2908_04030 [Candidatus Staskawiczbacteria bacterium RIFCSPLOWO2_01_FULL_38_12b]
MADILKFLLSIIKKEANRPTFYSIMVLAVLFCVISFFDKALAVGLLFLLFLVIATIFIIRKTGIKDKKLYTVFFIALLIHLGAMLFIYYGHFRPFGGGADFEGYNQTAIEIANRFSQGNFSLAGLYTDHFFPILIGILYIFVLPSMIVGQFFTVWLAVISILLVYVVIIEIGGTKKVAFLASLVISFYPSYLYFGSVLLKDTVVIPLVLLGVFLILKMVKRFSWVKFALFFILLTCLINLRFYIGYALMFSFIFSWPLLSEFDLKKKMIYWAAIIFLLGFSPQILGNGYTGNGYYGFDSFHKLLNPEKITYYREVLYSNNPSSNPKSVDPQPVVAQLDNTKLITIQPNDPQEKLLDPQLVVAQPDNTKLITIQPNILQEEPKEDNSTFVVKTGFNEGVIAFLGNSFQSFFHALLGPFPWQFNSQRQMVGLAETIPWYVLIIISVYGSIRFIKKKGMLEFLAFYKFSFPLLVFGILALGALSLFINNYGIIARIRIPVFICFICVMFISFNSGIENYYEKVPYHWRSWVHRIPFVRSAFKAEK